MEKILKGNFMTRIKLLDKQVANLIAAGEVVERPSSVVKELVENSIDAGGSDITIEIKNGGISFIRVTDNGCGMSYDDAAMSFKRHATSKISMASDLSAISTLGFRGEALAAISSVSKVELITCEKGADTGTYMKVLGGEITEQREIGAPQGTTITVTDIFFNTPARKKFLKKESTEAANIASLIEKISLSSPNISFRFIKDGREVLFTPGNGLLNAIYSIYGKEISSNLIEIDYKFQDVKVSGFVGRPDISRPNRNMQHFFINNRIIRSKILTNALEESFKNEIMTGKYPICFLNIYIDFKEVDVNVHPSKLEVKFSNENLIYEAVYNAVHNTYKSDITRPELKLPKLESVSESDNDINKTQSINSDTKLSNIEIDFSSWNYKPRNISMSSSEPALITNYLVVENNNIQEQLNAEESSPDENKESEFIKLETDESINDVVQEEIENYNTEDFKIIGELFKTYIIAEFKDHILLIDKHAAQERIIYERLKSQMGDYSVQTLLAPQIINLTREETAALISNLNVLKHMGFDAEEFGENTIIVRGVPIGLSEKDVDGIVIEIAQKLMAGNKNINPDIYDDIIHSIACKAAIKAGQDNALMDIYNLTKELLKMPDIKHCPHGRPVALELKKSYFDKQFKRIQ